VTLPALSITMAAIVWVHLPETVVPGAPSTENKRLMRRRWWASPTVTPTVNGEVYHPPAPDAPESVIEAAGFAESIFPGERSARGAARCRIGREVGAPRSLRRYDRRVRSARRGERRTIDIARDLSIVKLPGSEAVMLTVTGPTHQPPAPGSEQFIDPLTTGGRGVGVGVSVGIRVSVGVSVGMGVSLGSGVIGGVGGIGGGRTGLQSIHVCESGTHWATAPNAAIHTVVAPAACATHVAMQGEFDGHSPHRRNIARRRCNWLRR